MSRFGIYCRAKPKGSIRLFYKIADTAFWLCSAVCTIDIDTHYGVFSIDSAKIGYLFEIDKHDISLYILENICILLNS